MIEGRTAANPMATNDSFCCIKIINSNIAYMRIVDVANDIATKYMMVEGQYIAETMPSYEPYGLYKISILSNDDTVNIYLDAPLGLNETVSFADTHIHIPTDNGTTVISCDNTVQPEKIYIKYIGG